MTPHYLDPLEIKFTKISLDLPRVTGCGEGLTLEYGVGTRQLLLAFPSPMVIQSFLDLARSTRVLMRTHPQDLLFCTTITHAMMG